MRKSYMPTKLGDPRINNFSQVVITYVSDFKNTNADEILKRKKVPLFDFILGSDHDDIFIKFVFY